MLSCHSGNKKNTKQKNIDILNKALDNRKYIEIYINSLFSPPSKTQQPGGKGKKMNNKDMETSVLSQYSIIRTGFTLLPETETNKQTKYWKHFFKIPGNKGE